MRTSYLLILLLLSLFWGIAHAIYSKGSFQATRKMHSQAKGCSCHEANPSNDVKVWIEGPQDLHPGANGTYTVYVAGMKNKGAGFNVAASHGQLKPSESGVRIDSGEIVHSKPKLASSDTIKWFFNYTAPLTSVTSDTLFSTGLVSNNNGTRSGDKWNYGNDFIIAISGVAANFDAATFEELFQASLFQRETTTSPILDLEMRVADTAKVDVYTPDGKFVMNIKNEFLTKGEHVFPIPYGGLEAGQYYCRIYVHDQNDAIKFLIVK